MAKDRFGFMKKVGSFTCKQCGHTGPQGEHRLFDNDSKFGPLCIKCAEKRGYGEEVTPGSKVSAPTNQASDDRLQALEERVQVQEFQNVQCIHNQVELHKLEAKLEKLEGDFYVIIPEFRLMQREFKKTETEFLALQKVLRPGGNQ